MADLYCSFCLKSQHQVKKLVAGPGEVYICDACVRAARAFMSGWRKAPPVMTPPESLTTEHLLAQLPAIEATVRGKGNQLQWVVDQLRGREVSWAAIGAALGISRQSAWERFT